MLFHTWVFALFFVIIYSIYVPLLRTRLWLPWLLVSSYFFYGWWNPLYLILILYSTLLDYVVVILMDRSSAKSRWLWISILNNLFLLGFFKYAGFITENINVALGAMDLGYQLPAPNILLPVGLSFFTFQSMSYTIDFYRGHIAREKSFIRFATFVSFFPQLVAGPIERSDTLLPQLKRPPRITMSDITDGLSLFIVGLFKKVALANYLAIYVDQVYGNPAIHAAPALLLATFAFAWQIFFDFSGYTDMARGVARMMGFRLMLNFNNPYLATGLGDFWSRWHISLSTWFRDYVYIPLGGNRGGRGALCRNLLIVFVVSGLWHGAAWKFVVWGALFAIGAILMRGMERSPWYNERVPKVFKQTAVFIFVCFAWIFFRAENVPDAALIIHRMATSTWQNPYFPILALVLVQSVWIYQYFYESRLCKILDVPVVRIAIVTFMILYLCIVPGSPDKPFIYFQF